MSASAAASTFSTATVPPVTGVQKTVPEKSNAVIPQARPFAEQRGTSPAARRRRAIFGLLHRVEQHSLTGLINLSAATTEVGQLIVQRGRVCLAVSVESPAAAGAQSDDDRALALVVGRALSERVPLSRCVEHVDSGVMTRLRSGLRVLSARALRCMGDALASVSTPAAFHVRSAREDYDCRLTSSALDVFLACAADEQPDNDPIWDAYAVCLGSGAIGLFAHVEPGGRTAPVLAAGHNVGNLTLRDAVALVRCATELCRPWPLVHAESVGPSCVVFRGGGCAWGCVARPSGLALLGHEDPSKAESLISWALSRTPCPSVPAGAGALR